jgi:lipid-A-disaccharide synthase
MRIALTANGPGEVAGWARPLLRSLYARDPKLDVHLFLVPDDYATGSEAAMACALFPHARVYEPKEYVAFALGRSVVGEPPEVDVVQYLGGDLMHAMRIHKRLGGIATTYKFSRPRYAATIARTFAIDAKNVEQLRGWKTPADRIVMVGNLAIDGALVEAQQPVQEGVPDDGILVMPGSRGYEVEHLIPFFFTAARRMLRERPELRIAFGVSPFTDLETVRNAIARGGDPRIWSEKGRLVTEGDDAFLESLDGAVRIPVLRNALAAAKRARLVVTIPGTKTVEVAALGIPMVSITPLNAPEKITINGPLTYLDRVPLVGARLKGAAVLAVAKRFRYHTQPNMDADAMVICELRGTLSPGRVARVVLERYDDVAWLAATSARLGALYADHVGAADRMAVSLLELAG